MLPEPAFSPCHDACQVGKASMSMSPSSSFPRARALGGLGAECNPAGAFWGDGSRLPNGHRCFYWAPGGGGDRAVGPTPCMNLLQRQGSPCLRIQKRSGQPRLDGHGIPWWSWSRRKSEGKATGVSETSIERTSRVLYPHY
jgi:hypothetical protein